MRMIWSSTKKKSSIMIFNRCKKYVFQPVLYLEGKLLNVVNETKLVGCIISSDLKWSKNIKISTEKEAATRSSASYSPEICLAGGLSSRFAHLIAIASHSCFLAHLPYITRNFMLLRPHTPAATPLPKGRLGRAAS